MSFDDGIDEECSSFNLSNSLYIPKSSSHRNHHGFGSTNREGRDTAPISVARNDAIKEGHLAVFRELFLKALNQNQKTLLKSVDGRNSSLNALLNEISDKLDTPLSTLKLNARILRDLNLINYGSKNDPEPVTLTSHGKMVLDIIEKLEV
ncbi:MAG: hypothetical protein R6U17_00970 [Thermoplasmata archaeon]